MSNQDQIDYWNGDAGQNWVAAQETLDRLLAPLSDRALTLAAAQAEDVVLDVGCGCGETTLALAATGASVTGVDISAPMLAHAAQRAEARGLSVQWLEADAAAQTFDPKFSLLFSRFGIMFFDDPRAAFANLRSALAPQGRIAFVCWQAPQLNPWVSVAGRAIQPFLPETDPPPPRAPGPFAFAEADWVQEILNDAGFCNITLEAAEAPLNLGEDVNSALAFQQRIGPLARVMAELDGDARARALDACRAAIEPYAGPGGVEMPAAVWLVSAER